MFSNSSCFSVRNYLLYAIIDLTSFAVKVGEALETTINILDTFVYLLSNLSASVNPTNFEDSISLCLTIKTGTILLEKAIVDHVLK